jgi:hypothetical protein
MASGQEESSELQRIEDKLDALWEKLDEAQRRSLRGMSSDLNWIRRRGALPPKARMSSQVTEAELSALKSAQDSHDWYAMLHFLRVCAPAIQADLLAEARANCYSELGLPEIAAEARELAAELSNSL